ncbi:hypothetical protein X975_17934, partial [Stegodyphus mimosarum]
MKNDKMNLTEDAAVALVAVSSQVQQNPQGGGGTSEAHTQLVRTTNTNGPSENTIKSEERITNVNEVEKSKENFLKEHAFNKRLLTYALRNMENILELKEFLNSKRNEVYYLIEEKLKENSAKVNFQVNCVYERKVNEEIVEKNFAFKTKNKIILLPTDISVVFNEAIDKLIKESEDLEAKDSGWSLKEIIDLEIRLNKYIPLRGSTYLELPRALQSRKAIINVRNFDKECFRWAVISGLHPVASNPHRVCHYIPFKNYYNFSGISFPTKPEDVKIFERQNAVSINVYSFNKDLIVYPLVITNNPKEKHIDLLFFKSGDRAHYCLIRNLSRLVSGQLSKNKGRKFICRRCLLFFRNENALARHEELCSLKKPCKVVMPSKNEKWLTFKNIKHSLHIPFVIYADFECIVQKVDTCQPNQSTSFTNVIQKHIAVSFSYYVACNDNRFQKPPVINRGLDAPKKFLDCLRREAKLIENIYNNPKPMTPLDSMTQELHKRADKCYLCKKRFTIASDPKVCDHDHITGKYRGPAHQSCNLKLQLPTFIPVFFHNLSGYDAHLFIRELAFDDALIRLIPNNEERYISFSKKVTEKLSLTFIDTYRFMPASLESLVNNLTDEMFTHIRRNFKEDKVNLLLRKGIYPYDYMDDMQKFEDKFLPPREKFFNLLNEQHVTENDYEHAKNVWNTFDIENMGEYSDLYVKTDVLLLCDVFEQFRSLCLKTYELDPAWYFTAPGLSWDAMLKCTQVEIELFVDYDMLLFIEQGIRGGVSQCSKRYSRANHKYMNEHDDKKESLFLVYLDANNLYGWAMSQKLPLKNYQWCTITDINSIPNDSSEGYILEVDLDYPEDIHDAHSDLPLAPVNIVPPDSREKRLNLTLEPKIRYVLHFKALKQYIALGMVLKKIHRVLKFEQSEWLKPYINLNTDLRSKARNSFEKDFFKLMNNAIFGKTIENIRKRVDIKLCSNGKTAEKLVSAPNFKYRTIFSSNLAAFHMKKTKLTFNKPICIGMSILDLSKTLMNDFHYNQMKKKYGDNITLLYTDTDSLIYEIRTEDYYEDLKESIS